MQEFLLANIQGMTTVVYSKKDRDQYLQKGYRLVVETPPTSKSSSNESDVILINSITAKDLVEKLEVSRAIAKKIIDNRPYTAIEELIAIAPEITWTTYQLNFE